MSRTRRSAASRLAAALLAAAASPALGAELVVEWAPLAVPVEGYQVERRGGEAGQSFEPLARVGSDATRFSDTRVAVGERYCYRVRGVRGTRLSPPSPELCNVAQERAPEPPVQPEQVTQAEEMAAPEPLAVAPPPVARQPIREFREARALRRPRPVYPPAARLKDISGWVKLSYAVSADGTTRDVKVLAAEPPGVFDEAAIDAARQFVYAPRLENGIAVDGPTVETEITFTMENPGGALRHDPDKGWFRR